MTIYYFIGIISDAKVSSLWSSLNDTKKHIFTSEKFLKEATPAG